MALVKYNNNSLSSVTSAANFPAGSMTLIKTLTASSSATLSFVHGSSDVVLDSTYPIYVFKFINIHPSADGSLLRFNFSVDSGSNYNVTKTTTVFNANHKEDGSSSALGYRTTDDLAQSTSPQILNTDSGADNDQSTSGEMFLFNPSSTTFIKHFMSNVNFSQLNDLTMNFFTAGYGNTTSAINAVQFSQASGNIDSGKIKLYGIKDS
jgi:hypothetical protein